MFGSKLISKVIGEKGRWREYQARARRLPPSHRTAVEALERYLMYFGGADGTGASAMFEDLVELFEQSAASATPVREIVGDDPVGFIDGFIQNYPEGRWRVREQQRLIDAIERAEGQATRGEETSP